MRTAAIVGGGVGALAAAIRCAVKGYRVELFEQSDRLGGKLNELRMEGFRFDTGPSLFTLPALVDELFTLAGRNPADYLRYTRLDTITRYFYPDGVVFDALANPADFAAEAQRVFGTPAERVSAYLQQSEELYRATADLFVFSPFNFATLAKSHQARGLAKNPLSLLAHTSMHRVNQQRLQEKRLVQLFDRYATYNGSNPYKAPGTLTMITHLEHGIGAYFPVGGMYAIARALARLAEELGVEVHLNSTVDEIVVEDGRAAGLRVEGRLVAADAVICNADVSYAYRQLLPQQRQPLLQRMLKPSTSALIFYWGMDRQFPELELHNILFAQSYTDEFSHLSRGSICADPTVYIFIGSKVSLADAPAGKEGWFTMINVPANTGQDWNELVAAARGNIARKIERMLGIRVDEHLLCESVADPRTIERQTSSLHGALYGFSSDNPLSAFLRHPNRHPRIRGLYFVGGSVHPGGGIPLCLASAKIADTYF